MLTSVPKVIDAWMAALSEGRIHRLVVRDATGTMVGCTALLTEEMTW